VEVSVQRIGPVLSGQDVFLSVLTL